MLARPRLPFFAERGQPSLAAVATNCRPPSMSRVTAESPRDGGVNVPSPLLRAAPPLSKARL
jgi:hypothetical protein